MAGKRKIWHYLIALLILILLIAGGLRLHKKRVAEVTHIPTEPVAPWALHIEKVSDKPVDSGFPALAMVSTREEVTIMARISGRILKMGPREGVRVKAGDLLVHIDTREIEDTINSLRAQYVAMRADAKRASDEFKRETELLKHGGSSKSAVETRHTAFVAATQKVTSTEHEINALMVRKGYGKIASPVDGIIAKRLAEPGDMAVPNRSLYKITSNKGAIVRVELPQSVLHQVHSGTPMVLSYGGKQVTLSIHRIFPTVDARALGFAEADLDKIPFGLPSGARIACRIILKQSGNDGIRVPYGSLLCGDGDQQHCRLFKVVHREIIGHKSKNILKMVPVNVKLRGHEGIAVARDLVKRDRAKGDRVKGDLVKGKLVKGDFVKGKLSANDRVVVAHESVLLQLKDGDPVTIAKGELP